MRLVFFGSGEFALPTLRRLLDGPHEVPLVVTQPPRPAGRGRKTIPTPVAAFARDAGLSIRALDDVNTPDAIDAGRAAGARLGLVIAFGQKLKAPLRETLPADCINLHGSLLPKYRGAAPVNWAVIRGEAVTGLTVFRLVERMDAGPVLTTRRTKIRPLETAGELHDRLAELGVEAVLEALSMFEGDRTPPGTPQDESEATLAPKLTKSDGFIRFDRPARAVVNHVHGMTPWPGASAVYRSAGGRWERILLTRVRPVADPAAEHAKSSPPRDRAGTWSGSHGGGSLPPGTLDDRLFVAVSDGFVEILELKPSSGRAMSWQDYVNGRHVAPGDRLDPP